MLFVCAGVVLAQPANPDSEQAAEEDPVAPATSSDTGEVIPNHYIVVLNKDAPAPAAVASDLAEETDLEPTHVYDDALDGFSAEIPAGSVSEVRSDPRVESVIKDRVVKATAQESPTGVRRVDASKSSAAGNGSGKVNADIAILDTGIYKQHKDLNIGGGHNCVGKEGSNAWSDGNGHGTHVAGTAAAKDNSIGVAGVAPGARVWAVRVLNDRGVGSFGEVICGIDWVTGRRAEFNDGSADGDPGIDFTVANMSLGASVEGSDDDDCGWIGDGASAKLHKAVCNSVDAGVFYAVAAGNDGRNFSSEVPAAYNQVLTVTAMADFNGKPGGGAASTCLADKDDTLANFSNWTKVGSTDAKHTIAAPGVCIRSTWKNGGYKTISGTSMASPHVAGTAALCIATGNCPANNPAGTMTQLHDAAEARPESYGFVGDPNDPVVRRGKHLYYGYLEFAGGY